MRVVTIATNKRGYGEMAFNMAVSLKSFLPDVKITVISDGRIERIPHFTKVIDSVITVPERLNPFELKTRVYSLIDEDFLFIDADSIFIGDPSGVFKELQDKTFCMMEYFRHENSSRATVWAKISDIFSHYKLNECTFPEYNSSIFFARKTAENDAYFKEAEKAYNETPVKLSLSVGGYFPDEIAFGVASARLNHYSEIENWEPLFLQKDNNNPYELSTITSILTMAGGASPAYSVRAYNYHSVRASVKMGLPCFKFDQSQKVFHARG